MKEMNCIQDHYPSTTSGGPTGGEQNGGEQNETAMGEGACVASIILSHIEEPGRARSCGRCIIISLRAGQQTTTHISIGAALQLVLASRAETKAQSPKCELLEWPPKSFLESRSLLCVCVWLRSHLAAANSSIRSIEIRCSRAAN